VAFARFCDISLPRPTWPGKLRGVRHGAPRRIGCLGALLPASPLERPSLDRPGGP
jgi:hypothetical protein